MGLCQNIRKQSLGLPLAVTAAGTLGALLLGRKYHAAFGAAWALLSLVHGWQHFLRRRADERRSAQPLHGVEVASWLLGRLRLYCRALRGDAARAARVQALLLAARGARQVEVTQATGSVLISYDEDAAKAEAYTKGSLN